MAPSSSGGRCSTRFFMRYDESTHCSLKHPCFLLWMAAFGIQHDCQQGFARVSSADNSPFCSFLALNTREKSDMYSVGAYRCSIVRQLSGRIPCRHQCNLLFLTRGHLHKYRPAGQLTRFSSKMDKEHFFAAAVAPVAAGTASSSEGDLGEQQCRSCMQGHQNHETEDRTNLRRLPLQSSRS